MAKDTLWSEKMLWKKLGRYPRLVALGTLGIVLMLMAPLTGGQDDLSVKEETVTVPRVEEAARWEQKLQAILSEVKGAGTVEVMVQMEKERHEYEKNRTRETRSTGQGSSAMIEEKVVEEVVMERESGIERPIVKRTIPPAVTGVIVVTEGGVSSSVRAQIRQAVCAVSGIAVHRVKVLTKKREGGGR